MTKRGLISEHEYVRNSIREDIFVFAIPALIVFSAGLVVSAIEGFDGLAAIILKLVGQPMQIFKLSVWNIFGLTLFTVGLANALIAAITLGRNYSSTLVIRKDHQLVTHGVFRLSRHPIYLGVIIACISFPMYASSLYGFLIMVLLIPIFLYRIKIEEQLLIAEFGDSYRAYMDDTSKLIPFIY